MLEKITIKTLLYAVTLLMLVSLTPPVYLFTAQSNDAIALVKKERTGLEYIAALRGLIQDVPRRRGASNVYLGGDAGFRDKVLALDAAIDGHLRTVDVQDQTLGAELHVSAAWSAWKARYQALRGANYAGTASLTENLNAHNALITDLNALIGSVAKESGLVLDPEVASYYLMDSTIGKMLELLETLGQTRAGGLTYLGLRGDDKKADQLDAQRLRLSGLLGGVQRLQTGLTDSLNQAREALTVEQKQRLSTQQQQQFYDVVEGKLLKGRGEGMPAGEYYTLSTSAIDATLSLYDQAYGLLGEVLADRQQRLEGQRNATLMTLMTLMTIAIVGLFYAIRRITVPLERAVVVARQLAAGDLSFTLDLHAQDETGQVLRAIAEVQGSLQALAGDVTSLVNAALAGQLAVRVDAAQHQGEYQRIVEGINDTLDAVVGPLNTAAQYVADIAAGAIPPAITDAWPGDFNALKDNINLAIGAVEGLVGDATRLSQAIVDGNLAAETDAAAHRGDYRRIIEAFERALVGLNHTFQQIGGTVEQVGDAAGQLNDASHNLAATAEQQSASVEEVTSSLEETDSQVKANTDSANQANRMVQAAAAAAHGGQGKMLAMVEAMGAIDASAQSIAKIIKVIDEIAFQTNLLALNAAVEAARAGQHGRGFAVVAQEVRNLAGRSAKAARETADLIEDSTRRVREGVDIADATREGLDQIVDNVAKVKDLVAEIAAASDEQSCGVSQINLAMNQVAKAAQESSQQAEELASASGELTSVAGRMREEVRRFTLRERQGTAGGAVAAAPAPRAAPAAKGGKPAKTLKSAASPDSDARGFRGF